MKITNVDVIPVTKPREIAFRDSHGAWGKDGKYEQAAHMGEKNYIIAKIQLGVSVRNMKMAGEFTELCVEKDPIIEEPFKIVDGFLEPRHKPGLGIELDQDKVKKYTKRL